MIIQERERSAERNSCRNPPGSQHRAADHGQRDNRTHHAIDARLQRADGLISDAWHTHTVSDFTHESSRRFYMARRELPNWSAGISACFAGKDACAPLSQLPWWRLRRIIRML